MPQREHLDVVGHHKYHVSQLDPDNPIPIDNIIIQAAKPEDEWLQESMELIGKWRAIFRSIYIKWSLAINGLHIALDKYSDKDWQSEKEFFVRSLRTEPTGKLQPIQLAVWNGPETVKNHQAVIPQIAGWESSIWARRLKNSSSTYTGYIIGNIRKP